MGFEAHEEPAGSDRVDCANIGTSNDPYVFSSVAHGDPPTPLLKAYVGDPVVIRQVGLDEQVGDIRVTGHRFAEERFNPNGAAHRRRHGRNLREDGLRLQRRRQASRVTTSTTADERWNWRAAPGASSG